MPAARPMSSLIPVRRDKQLLEDFLTVAPCALAFERYLEFRLHGEREFRRPVLDLGCGDGVFAGLFFQEPVDVGVEPDSAEAFRCRLRGSHREVFECRGDRIPIPASSVATVFANSVLEHILELEPVLDEIARVLRPGGRFICTVPSHRFDRWALGNQLLTSLGMPVAATGFRAWYNRFWKHHHAYEPARWVTLFEARGLEIHEVRSFASPRICLLNDLLVPFAAGSFLRKRLSGSWRPPGGAPGLARLVALLARRVLAGGERSVAGGLVSIEARKPCA